MFGAGPMTSPPPASPSKPTTKPTTPSASTVAAATSTSSMMTDLSRVLREVGRQEGAERERAADAVAAQAEQEERAGGEGQGAVERRVFASVQSAGAAAAAAERLGALAVLGALIGRARAAGPARVARYANCVRVAIGQSGAGHQPTSAGGQPPASGAAECAVLAAASLGRLAAAAAAADSPAGALAAELVEFEAKRALEWLQAPPDHADSLRRLTASLVLHQLLSHAPTLVYGLTPRILESVWPALRDPLPRVRAAAAAALAATLSLVLERDASSNPDPNSTSNSISNSNSNSNSSRAWYRALLDEARRGLRVSSAAAVHGSLLAIACLLARAPRFVAARFPELCDIVLRYKDHRDPVVRQAVVAIIPDLALFDPDHFVAAHLPAAVAHLLALTKRDLHERAVAFIAIGRLAVAVGRSIADYLVPIVAAISDALHASSFPQIASSIPSSSSSSHTLAITTTTTNTISSSSSPSLRLPFSSLSIQSSPAFTSSIHPPSSSNFSAFGLGSIAPLNAPSTSNHTSGATHNLIINNGIPGASLPTIDNDPSAGPFQCISLLAVAVGPSLTNHIHGILDYMFAGNLTDPLCQALVDLSVHIPQLLPLIQDRLLNAISFILLGRPFAHPGAPESISAINAIAMTGIPKSIGIPPSTTITTATTPVLPTLRSNDQKDIAAVLLALRTLGSFDFKGHLLHEFVREIAWLYLDADDAQIRRTAALTCCQILARDPVAYQTSTHAMQLVSDVLDRLLAIAIGDPDPSIRQAVLLALDERFDHHLAQAEHIQSTLIALGDEVFAVREAALVIVGRLALHNPAFILPSLRKLLVRLLTELRYATSSRQKEESAMLLARIVRAAPSPVEPYAPAILAILFGKVKDPNPSVASHAISAIGELANIASSEIALHRDSIMVIVLEALQDQSSPAKREAALQTLANMASNTGWVIEPYLAYPNLLNLLIQILKTEQNQAIRRQTVRVIGILGALDPYRYKISSGPTEAAPGDAAEGFLSLGLSPSSEDYYPAVATGALLKILRDPSLSVHHTAAVTALLYIFKTLTLKCVPFLPQILPTIFAVMRSCPPNTLEFYFQQLGMLVMIVKQHIRPYITDFIQLIQDDWTLSANIQSTALALIEFISSALEGEFKVYLPTLLPMMLQIFETDTTDRRTPSQRLLKALLFFGALLEDYLHLVIPALVRVIERVDHPIPLRQQAVLLIGELFRRLNLVLESSPVVHVLARTLSTPNLVLRGAVLNTLCTLVYQIGDEYTFFAPMVHKVMIRYGIRHEAYEALVKALVNHEPLPRDLVVSTDRALVEPAAHDTQMEALAKKLPVNQQQLKKAWETTQRSTRDDWQEWIRRFSVELLKESPSHALRACANLASTYSPLARELFNPAFVSCWCELYDQFQEELVRSLETALTSPNIPPETLQTLLNLAEFMEHDDKALPIDIRTLGLYATKCHAYAKALHYKELEFISESMTTTIEALITIHHQLQQPDSAVGILTYAQQNHDVELKESWYERLQRWEDGLAAYERKLTEDPASVEAMLGRMRCLQNLGEWEALSTMAQTRWPDARADVRKAMAPLAAAAAWGLGQWDMMDEYITTMRHDSPDSAFFRAILALHRNHFSEAKHLIDRTRDLLDTELAALVGESYSRAYGIVVRIQMLAELDEIIQYKLAVDTPDTQHQIGRTWITRIKGCQRHVEVWQRILRVHALVVHPRDDVDIWVKFASLCRKSGRLGLAFKTLNGLLAEPVKDFTTMVTSSVSTVSVPSSALMVHPPRVVYACLKHAWAVSPRRDVVFMQMRAFTGALVSQLGSSLRLDFGVDVGDGTASASAAAAAITAVSAHGGNGNGSDDHSGGQAAMVSLLARCFLKLGDWQVALTDTLTETVIPEMLRSYLAATQCDKTWYKAWHAWAHANFEVVATHERVHHATPPSLLISHVVPSVQGFFRSIALSKTSSLQDALRLLTMWFKYGHQQEVNMAMSEGFHTVSIATWLQVIPQLIARIHAPAPHVRRLIHQLLTDIGKEHPQALVYSLTVASKSQSVNRRRAALAILDRMRTHSAALVEQAMLVSQELIRVAILWHEMWHEGLEEASRLFYGERNIDGMFATLEPLHHMLDRGAETLREITFIQTFGRDLAEAYDWCRRYKRTLNADDLNQAWDLYYQVFRKISKQLPQLTTLELQHVSPKLLAAKDLELAVPGSYRSGNGIDNNGGYGGSTSGGGNCGDSVIRIASFVPTLIVMSSKQRPRRLNIKGSDGKEYQFLLKGHEDLRQDERVMQLFGLVNTLLAVDPESFKRHLSIHRYPVIPLSPNSGLIGWVPHCDTLHSLIRDYRESRKILLNIEHRLMLQMAPDYDNLTLLQKVEVFEYALENTTGQDLYKVLWLKSKNSEVWLDRRTNYTRSLAVMSMVGYILGLGDRHPSNLMLDRFTGKVIHIDFGDCFEVAIHRDRYPEKIPFRLTRMLINAMEVSGIEGHFRITCESVMRVLRDHKDSLMAVLEAFVYDPLINWRLVTPAAGGGGAAGTAAAGRGDSDAIAMATATMGTGTLVAVAVGGGNGGANVGARTLGTAHPATTAANAPTAMPSAINPSTSTITVSAAALALTAAENDANPEALNAKAIAIINRVSNKLTGRDFRPTVVLDVPMQVQKLILQATSLENLSQCFIGWCPFW